MTQRGLVNARVHLLITVLFLHAAERLKGQARMAEMPKVTRVQRACAVQSSAHTRVRGLIWCSSCSFARTIRGIVIEALHEKTIPLFY